MKQLKIIFSFLLISLILFPNISFTEAKKSIFIRESDIVMTNGSRPSGFYETLEKAGINQDSINCNSQNRYGKFLKDYSEHSANDLLTKLKPYLSSNDQKISNILDNHIMWAMVRSLLVEGDNNNLGVFILNGYYWTDNNGKKRPLTVFRAGFTPNPDESGSCYQTLLKSGNVRHVVNLYDGVMDLNDLINKEKTSALKEGASYVKISELYGDWQKAVRKKNSSKEQIDKASKTLSMIIEQQILTPNGDIPKGNIFIHCAGGMHRSGIVSGILQRVINKEKREIIESAYKYHTGYKSETEIGGFEQDGLDYIFSFDTKLINHQTK